MRRFRSVLISALLCATPIGGQGTDTCAVPIPRYGDGLEFFDRLEALYLRLDAAFFADLASSTARLSDEQLSRFDRVRRMAHDAFGQIGAKEAGRLAASSIYTILGSYTDYLNAGYNDQLPPAIRRLFCPIETSYLLLTMTELENHDMQMEVRYGKLSERLNIAEMLLDQWMSRKLGSGQLREPPRLEWILRVQVVGYQYDSRIDQFRPSSPTYQLGASYYLFGKGSGLINHIGLAAAYQRDLSVGGDLWGGVLHVRDYDFGVLCPKGNCRDYVIVASKNFSALAGTWTKLRKWTNRD